MTYQHKLPLLLALFISTVSFSQKTGLGITAGVALANMKSYVDNKKADLKSKTGLTIGVLTNIGISPNISIQPALNFVQKGAKETQGNTTSTLALNYLELPINLLLTSKQKHGFFAGAGPVISYGLSGKFKVKSANSSGSEDIEFGSGDNDDFEAMELSGNVLAGFKLPSGLLFAINYNHGFSNLFHSNEDGELKNRYFGIRVGYLFAKK